MKLRIDPQHLPAVLLIAVSLLFALKLAAELEWSHPAGAPAAPGMSDDKHALTTALLPEFALPQLQDSYKESLARPLFTPNRRPSLAASDSAAPSAMRKGQFNLVGVVLAGKKKFALLKELSSGKEMSVDLGKEINGMKLERLAAERATLQQGDEREELVLKIQPMASQPRSAAPPANAGVPGQNAAPSAANPMQTAAPPVQTPATTTTAPGMPPLSEAMRQLIARRRASHGLPPE